MHVLRFETWGEFLDFTETPLPANVIRGSVSRDYNDSGDRGTNTFPEAMHIARNGWDDGTKQIKALSEELVDKVTSSIEVPEIVFDVTGRDFSIDAVLRNEPESWYDFENQTRENEGQKNIKLVVSCSASGDVSGSAIIGRGAAICALIELLEMVHFRVELTVIWAKDGCGANDIEDGCDYSVVLKTFSQPVDMPRLAFALANPAMLRRLMFSVVEHFPKVHRSIGGTLYGIHGEPADKGDIFVPRATSRSVWTDPVAAREWVIEHLKTQGVHLKDTD